MRVLALEKELEAWAGEDREMFFWVLIQAVKQNLLAQALELRAVGSEFLSPSDPLEKRVLTSRSHTFLDRWYFS